MSETYDSSRIGPDAIPREPPDPPEARRAFVSRLQKDIRADKKHWEKSFKRMREDMDFVFGLQWEGQKDLGDDRYVANFVSRQIGRRTDRLYARNPKAVARRRQRLDFELWDENEATLIRAQGVLAGVVPADPGAAAQAQDLIQDVERGRARRDMLDRVARSMELVWQHEVDEQLPGFKAQMKQLVRRTQICGVGYVKLGYHRMLGRTPDWATKLSDATDRLAAIRGMAADIADGVACMDSAEAEDLRLTVARLQAEPETILREGLTFDFPLATRIIPDRACRQLQGWVGADRVTEEYLLSPEDVKQTFGVDLGSTYKAYDEAGTERSGDDGRSRCYACVWQVYHRKSGNVFWLAEGWPDLLKEPEPPILRVERFYPWFALVFNGLEHPTEIYPPSDARLLRHIQREYNRNKEALRQHRIANQPLYVTPAGSFGEKDKVNLADHVPHDVIPLQGLKEGQKSGDLLQAVQKAPIDPNVYETGTVRTDMELVAGSQEADLGATGGATATESSIAAGARVSSESSQVDDLDGLLTDLARSAGQVLLAEMAPETAREIAGPGAVWPTFSGADLASEVYLEIEAGSSGRPNRAQEVAVAQQMLPLLIQLPGVDPLAVVKWAARRLDDRIDINEFLKPGAPSIVAMNGAVRPATGDPSTDPAMQAGRGSERPGPAGPAGTAMPMGDAAARINGGMAPA